MAAEVVSVAESKIIKSTGTVESYTFTGYSVGSSNTRESGYYMVNRNLKLVEFEFNLNTATTLSAGTAYNVGGVAVLGLLPYHPIRCEVNRVDTGNAPATLQINTVGAVTLHPLGSIPSGVNLRAHCMYFYQ